MYTMERHSISNADYDARRGDCTVCGIDIKLRVRVNEHGTAVTRCRSRYRRLTQARSDRLKPDHLPLRSSVTELRAAFEAQAGACAICLKVGATLGADHDHATGHFRAWLCNHCNLLLAYASENPATLRRAAGFLER